MNFSIFKDRKFLLGMISTFVFNLIGLILVAITENDYWIVCIIISYILLFLSIQRAAKLYKKKDW